MELKTLIDHLKHLAPLSLAASWDNVGYLVSTSKSQIKRVILCVTLTEEVLEEAHSQNIDLIICHHPFPFKGLKQILDYDPEGRLTQKLCRYDIALYSAHTAWDQAPEGINNTLLTTLFPTAPTAAFHPLHTPAEQPLGSGKHTGLTRKVTLKEVLITAEKYFSGTALGWVAAHKPSYEVQRPSVGCGVGSSLVDAVIQKKSDLFITGELRYHELLQLKAHQVSVIILGHFASERIGMEHLKEKLSEAYTEVDFVLSQCDTCPLQDLNTEKG